MSEAAALAEDTGDADLLAEALTFELVGLCDLLLAEVAEDAGAVRDTLEEEEEVGLAVAEEEDDGEDTLVLEEEEEEAGFETVELVLLEEEAAGLAVEEEEAVLLEEEYDELLDAGRDVVVCDL